MDKETIWKHCALCDAHFPQEQLKEHMTLWHATEKSK